MAKTRRLSRYVIPFIFLGSIAFSTAVCAQNAGDVLQGIFDIVKQAKKLKHKHPAEEATATTPSDSATYSVGGMRLGEQVNLNASYDCKPSEQFTGFDWCSTTSREHEARGSFEQKTSILRSAEGRAEYLNRFLSPAFFDRDEINNDIQALTRKFGMRPKISTMPSRSNLPRGIIATWGDVTLEEIDKPALAALAKGESPQQGLFVDFLNDLTTSAREQLPIYKLGGGPGYIWIAIAGSVDRRSLRFLAVDVSALQGTSNNNAASPAQPASHPDNVNSASGEPDDHDIAANPREPQLEGHGPLIAELRSQYQLQLDNLHTKGVADAEIDSALSDLHCPSSYVSPSDYRCAIGALRAVAYQAEWRTRQEQIATQQKQEEETAAVRLKSEQEAAAQRARDEAVTAAARAKAEQEAAAQRAREEAEAKAKEAAERAKAIEQQMADQAEAERKGLEFAKSSGTSWSLRRTHNEMTDKDIVFVSSSQTNDGGALANVTGKCESNGLVSFKALVVDQEGKPTVNFPNLVGDPPAFVRAQLRVNDFPASEHSLKMASFNNEFKLADLKLNSDMVPNEQAATSALGNIKQAGKGNDPSAFYGAMNNFVDAIQNIQYGVLPTLPSAIVWRIMVEINTDHGALLIKLPLFERRIRELFLSCGEPPRKYEVNLPSTPDESNPSGPALPGAASGSFYAAVGALMTAFGTATALLLKREEDYQPGILRALKNVFLKLDGRVNRSKFLKYSGLYIGFVLPFIIAIALATGADASASLQGSLAITSLTFALGYPLLALAIKRMQDRDYGRTITITIWLFSITYANLRDYLETAGDEPIRSVVLSHGWLMVGLALVVFGSTIWLTVQACFLKGTSGPNKFGEDPLAGANTSPAMAT
jgi:uncharacterized membrane protein YhaH (DUF805 family)